MKEGIEYIFVNDCSPDNTMSILFSVIREYPDRSEQIHIIDHPSNLGAVQSRKDGISEAKGQYVIFCDHDDWVEPEMYEKLYAASNEGRADFVACGFYRYDKGKIVGKYIPDINLEASDSYPDIWNAYLWLHLVRRELYLKHYDDFIPCKYCEDVFPLCHIYYYAIEKRVLQTPLYHHIDNPDSITRSMDIASNHRQIYANFIRVNQLYHRRELRKTFHKYLLFLKYSSKPSFHSLWQFYWTFRMSSLFIVCDHSVLWWKKLKMFVINNNFLIFYLNHYVHNFSR